MLIDAWKTFRLLHEARSSSHWSSEKIRSHQENRLRDLLNHAYRHVPLYRRLYDQSGFHPEQFRTLDDLTRIPSLPKPTLKNASTKDVLAHGTDLNICRQVDTSGTTGVPLKVYLGPAEVRWQRAVAWRILFEHGFRWTDRTLEIRMTLGENFFIQKLGVAPKTWVSILDPPESWAKQLEEKKHNVLVAGASTLDALADTVASSDRPIHPPRIIISDSELLTPDTRQRVRRVLGMDPVDVFGLVELSNFAWQCEQRDGFHISADSHIVEIDDMGEGTGPMIVTDLGMWTMPMIRYETGDTARFSRERCRCSRNLPKLERLFGRSMDSVILPSGRRLFWPFFYEILGSYTDLKQWRVIQRDLNDVVVELVIPAGNRLLIEKIKNEINSRLPEKIPFNYQLVDRIPHHPAGKLRLVSSQVTTGSSPQSVPKA